MRLKAFSIFFFGMITAIIISIVYFIVLIIPVMLICVLGKKEQILSTLNKLKVSKVLI